MKNSSLRFRAHRRSFSMEYLCWPGLHMITEDTARQEPLPLAHTQRRWPWIVGTLIGPPQVPSTTAQLCAMRGRYHAVISRRALETAAQYVHQGDQLAAAMVLESDGRIWPAGTQVYVEQRDRDRVQIRLAGLPVTYWTLRQEVECGR
jgi:hypothetical protein